MTHRFFVHSEIPGEHMVLDGDQAHHAIHVMRFGVGDQIELFDGKGNSGIAEIASISKKRLNLLVQSRSFSPRESQAQVCIATALPKGDRQRFLVEKLVELGVARLVPLKTQRSVAVGSPKALVRLEKQVVEACKQCGRHWLMTIGKEATVDNLLADIPVDGTRWVAHPGASRSLGQVRSELPTTVAVGPEGGFTDRELEQFESAGWNPVSLASNILRTETAAMAAAILAAQSGR